MLCYVMLRYVTLRYVTLCYVLLHYVTLSYVMLCYVRYFVTRRLGNPLGTPRSVSRSKNNLRGVTSGIRLVWGIYIYYLPAGRSVLRKTVPEVLSTALGLRPRAVLKTSGTVFLNTDRPRPANNISIFFLLFFKS